MAISTRVNRAFFNAVHGNSLVYNTCWEDPRLDREALAISPDDTLVVITSAGCNVLDYALDRPKLIHAVDVNPRQNALLELKVAGIRALDYDEFFALFGAGHLPGWDEVYRRRLRPLLSASACRFWDSKLSFFNGTGRGGSFYFHGTAGIVARAINLYIDCILHLRDQVEQLLNAGSLEEQQCIYYEYLHSRFWNKWLCWLLSRDATMSMLGVPRPQIEHIEHTYAFGLVGFIRECLEYVFARLPISDNYFWRVYLTGQYSSSCCPEYLKKEHFETLKAGGVDCIQIHTNTVEGFINGYDEEISRFVLLDHMDWLSSHDISALRTEWEAILAKASRSARIIWRSGGTHTDFVDRLVLRSEGAALQLSERLSYHRELAARLHTQDRVHTYGSFHIADVLPA